MYLYVFYFFIGLIVSVCILASENSKLKNENNRLKEEIQKIKNGTIVINNNQSQVITQNSSQQDSQNNYSNMSNRANTNYTINSDVIKTEQVKKQSMSTEQRKNVMILVSGAIFIVLSAIVFLMSTWNIIPNLLKTLVLVLLIGVFLGASQIADKKFKLKFTSATFYYLAMAYIPIMLYSIWGFELLGKYLSIHGKGSYIYLTLMSCFVSYIYFAENKKRKGVALLVISSLFQILSVIYGVMIFTKNAGFVWMGMSVYSLLIGTLPYTLKNKENRKYYKYYAIVTMILTMTGITFNTIGKWLLVRCEILQVVNWLLVIANISILKNNKIIYKKNTNLALNEILNIAVLFETLTILNIKNIVLIAGAKLFTISIVALLEFILDYLKYDKSVFKIISYLLTNLVLLAMVIMMDLTEYAKYIPVISTGIAVLSEQIKKDKEIKYYIIASFIVSFVSININPSIGSFLVLLVAIASYKFYEKYSSLDYGWDIVPAIAIVPSIYSSEIFIIKGSSFNYAIIISVALIMYEMMKSIKEERLNQNTIISLCYVVLTVISFSISSYLKALLFVMWSVLHITIHKNKKIYQPVLFISLLVIYLLGINDLKLNEFSCINIFGYIMCTLAITRITLSKEKELSKVIEYIVFAIIYWVSIYIYKSVADAMITIGMMLALVIVGYINKMGPIFLTSLIAIVINGVQLTKEFWLSIPWWIYLLIIGVTLILFAVNNEINQKGNRQSLVEKLKRLKKEINM